PDTTFRVHSDIRPYSGTFREVELVARRLATGLQERGIEPGDVVALQLPNWMEAAAAFWAASLLGTVVVPIVHTYGSREVGHIVDTVRPKAFFGAERFGNLVYDPAVYADVSIVGIVGGSNSRHHFDALLADEAFCGVTQVDPDGPAVIAFTSGTTQVPKGVVHSHRTLGCETRLMADRFPDDLGP